MSGISGPDQQARTAAAAAQAAAAAAQAAADIANGLVPFAACVFSVTAGVLTVHKSRGLATFTKVGAGSYAFTFTTPEADVFWLSSMMITRKLAVEGIAEIINHTVNGATLLTFNSAGVPDDMGFYYSCATFSRIP